jgi:ribosomal protein L7/L12
MHQVAKPGTGVIIVETGALLLVGLVFWVAWRKSAPGSSIPAPPSQVTDADIERLVTLGRKIDAIKLYRKLHGTDLKTAKDAIDNMKAQRDREAVRRS